MPFFSLASPFAFLSCLTQPPPTPRGLKGQNEGLPSAPTVFVTTTPMCFDSSPLFNPRRWFRQLLFPWFSWMPCHLNTVLHFSSCGHLTYAPYSCFCRGHQWPLVKSVDLFKIATCCPGSSWYRDHSLLRSWCCLLPWSCFPPASLSIVSQLLLTLLAFWMLVFLRVVLNPSYLLTGTILLGQGPPVPMAWWLPHCWLLLNLYLQSK